MEPATAPGPVLQQVSRKGGVLLATRLTAGEAGMEEERETAPATKLA